MGLVEKFKQCSVEEGNFRRRGGMNPPSEERKEIARIISEHLDEVGADIRPNLVEAIVEAFGLADYYLSKEYTSLSAWFAHSSNRHLENPYGIRTKSIGEAITDYVKSHNLNDGADEIKLNCSSIRGGIGSIVYYKNEKRLEKYLSETVRKPRTIFEFTFESEPKIEEGRSS